MKTLLTNTIARITGTLTILGSLVPALLSAAPAPLSNGEIALFINNVETEIAEQSYTETSEQQILSAALTHTIRAMDRSVHAGNREISDGAIELFINDVEEQMARNARIEFANETIFTDAMESVNSYYAATRTTVNPRYLSDSEISLFISGVEESMSTREHTDFSENQILHAVLAEVTISLENTGTDIATTTRTFRPGSVPTDVQIARFIDQVEETMELVPAEQEVAFTIQVK